jgi:hypothetical protein
MTENDVGMRVVGFVHRLLEIDKGWTRYGERGFTWWPAAFAQQVWAEPPYEDDGTTLRRLHVQTDFWQAPPGVAVTPPFDTTGMGGVVTADDDPTLFRLGDDFRGSSGSRCPG